MATKLAFCVRNIRYPSNRTSWQLFTCWVSLQRPCFQWLSPNLFFLFVSIILVFFFLMPVTRVRPDPDDVSDVAGTVLFEGRQLEKVSRAPVEKLW